MFLNSQFQTMDTEPQIMKEEKKNIKKKRKKKKGGNDL